MFSSPEQYGGTQNGIPILTVFLQEVSTKSGSSIDNGSTVYDLMSEKFLRNSEDFLPDPIVISSNEGIEAYRFLKYELDNCKFSLYHKVF